MADPPIKNTEWCVEHMCSKEAIRTQSVSRNEMTRYRKFGGKNDDFLGTSQAWHGSMSAASKSQVSQYEAQFVCMPPE